MKKKIEFDDLDIKCLTEMPLIIDVIAATGKKVCQLFKSYKIEIESLIDQNKNESWSVDQKTTPIPSTRIYPFTSDEGKKISITDFELRFKIECAYYLSKTIEKKEVSGFWIYFGYLVDLQEEETVNSFYFIVQSDNVSKQKDGLRQNSEFYKLIIEKFPTIKVEFNHPEVDAEYDQEYFEIYTDEFSVNKLDELFKIYKEEVVSPIIQAL